MADNRWDAIVVGSGLGGLTTAAYLATNGLRTLVLEQYDTIGGCSHVFRRKRSYEFDVGVHYVGDCAPDGGIPTVLRGVGLDDRVEFLELDPDGFSTLVFPQLTFRVPRGWDRYLERLIETFPEQERGLRRCVGVLRRIGAEMDQGIVPVTTGGLVRFPARSPLTATVGLLPLRRLLDACRLSEEARAVICGEGGDYASPPSRVPIALHAGLMNHYIKSGAYYPKGGGQVLAAHLLDVIQAHEGAARTQARVERVLIEGGRAVGVQLVGGEQLLAPVIVSNADIKRTFSELVGFEHLSWRTRRRVARYRMALPLFSVYLGLDCDLRDRMPNTQFWTYPTTDIEWLYSRAYESRLIDSPPVYMTSGTMKDPGNPHAAPEGHSTLELMTVVPPDYDLWGVLDGPAAGERYSRDARYRAIKDEITEKLIARAERQLPGLRDHIVWQEAATPITQERYTLSTGGACYGLELATDQFGPRRPGPRTEIGGLFLCGASTAWCHGIYGVMTGGVGTASAVLGRDLLGEVRGGRVFADRGKLTAGGESWDPLAACRGLAEKSRAVARSGGR